MHRRYRSIIASLALVAFATMPLIAFAQACGVGHGVSTSHTQTHPCGDPCSSEAPNACQSHCNPEFPLDTGSVAPPVPPASPALIVEVASLARASRARIDDVPFAGAPPPTLRFCRLLI
jgi:hypothetical protein